MELQFLHLQEIFPTVNAKRVKLQILYIFCGHKNICNILKYYKQELGYADHSFRFF